MQGLQGGLWRALIDFIDEAHILDVRDPRDLLQPLL